MSNCSWLKPNSGYEEAIELIEECRREKDIYLPLSGLNLKSLPSEIWQLTQLCVLELDGNALTEIPAEIGNLKSLLGLYLGRNRLISLPNEIGRLNQLEVLYAYKNSLSSLPSSIEQLTKLNDLTLFSNCLTSLPPEIGQLKRLRELDIRWNRLSRLNESLRQLKQLKVLLLHGNPALHLSHSILGSDDSRSTSFASPKSILDYYFERRKADSKPLNEVKVILVGRGGAGKTSTVQALSGVDFNAKEKSTPGIALCDLPLQECRGGPVTAHIWDFAGQVITHALHQFFFSVRSVYVLVLTGRENSEREDAEYWLRLIRAFGTDGEGEGPPVIVALNKWDEEGCRPKIDKAALQERYPFIRAFVETDCQTKRGIEKLRKALCTEVSRLEWVREPFPVEWANVRKALGAGRRKRSHLSYNEFRQICTDNGVPDSGEQDSVSEILHNLGAALNYRNDPRLREATVLQPEWLTRNVYALVRRAEKQNGVLKQDDVDSVLRREPDPKMRQYLVQIMERFEISYASKAHGGVWLVPQALPDQQPKGLEPFRDAEVSTQLRYTYPALPEGLVARAIVRLHEFIEVAGKSPQQWASGAVLTRKGVRALIRTEPQDRQVMITVIGGTPKARQQLAGLCQSEMRKIHQEIRGLAPVEETRVSGFWVQTATLEFDELYNQETGISTPNLGTISIDPEQANNAFTERSARQAEIWKPTVFISYSKSNVAERKSLELQLIMLCNEGLLAGHWHDRMIDPGDDWDSRIQDEISGADVFIMLASAASLSTEYITKTEIPNALKLHNAGKTVVVPVVLEACRWAQTPLGKLNALPEKGKALNKWNPRADGWNSVADGLAGLLKKLIAKGPPEGFRLRPSRILEGRVVSKKRSRNA